MDKRVIQLFLFLITVFLTVPSPNYARDVGLHEQEIDDIKIFLPMIRLPYTPPTPVLHKIENGDLDNTYTVSWDPIEDLDTPIEPTPLDVTIEEATNPEFIDATVYHAAGSDGQWPPNSDTKKLPGTYYYRAKTSMASLVSGWSNLESVTINPLFVGLQIRWDGIGYFRGSRRQDIGWHGEWNANGLTEGDTLRVTAHAWYDSGGLEDENVDLFYSATTGEFRATSIPRDPSWKWPPWRWGVIQFLRYDLELFDGQTISIGNQPFEVKGPFSGYTSYGRSIQYWELVNKEEFLMYDDGRLQQRVNEGDAILRYHTGPSRLLLYSSIRRYYYQDDEETGDTIQYIAQLTSSNVLSVDASVWQQSTLSTNPDGIDKASSSEPIDLHKRTELEN